MTVRLPSLIQSCWSLVRASCLSLMPTEISRSDTAFSLCMANSFYGDACSIHALERTKLSETHRGKMIETTKAHIEPGSIHQTKHWSSYIPLTRYTTSMEMHKIEIQSKRQAMDIIWERLCKEEPLVLVVVLDLPYLSASAMQQNQAVPTLLDWWSKWIICVRKFMSIEKT